MNKCITAKDATMSLLIAVVPIMAEIASHKLLSVNFYHPKTLRT